MGGETLKKGSAELLILTMLSEASRHGYEIGKLIELRSDGRIQFHISSLYPILVRMQKRGWISGRWVEQKGQRRRRYYHLTPKGKQALAEQRREWEEFSLAVNDVIGLDHA